MTDSVSIAAAFGAGVLSFLAPCTLALVPAFILYLAGFTLADRESASAGRLRLATALNTLAFVLGFSAVFVLLGSSLGALSNALGANTRWLNWIGGSLVIMFGLVTLGLVKVTLFERGFSMKTDWAPRLRYFGSFLVGATFAVGWVPCVGPILAAILVLAGTSGAAGSGAILLFAYSIGLMLPFMGAGLFAGWTSALVRRHGRFLQGLTYAGGVGLIALGILVFTNLISKLANYVPVTKLASGS